MKHEPHRGVELEDSGEINISDHFSQSNGSWVVWEKHGDAGWSWWLLEDWSM